MSELASESWTQHVRAVTFVHGRAERSEAVL
jgi:hypothetical protein